MNLDDPQPGRPAVTISDFDMPFFSMVKFMIKWAIASIPAVIVLAAIFSFVAALVFGSLGILTSANVALSNIFSESATPTIAVTESSAPPPLAPAGGPDSIVHIDDENQLYHRSGCSSLVRTGFSKMATKETAEKRGYTEHACEQ